MSLAPAIARPWGAARPWTCVLCRVQPQRRSYVKSHDLFKLNEKELSKNKPNPRLSPSQQRDRMDALHRSQFLEASYKNKITNMNAKDAESIIKDFLASSNPSGTFMQELAKKNFITVRELTVLGIMIMRIPNASKKPEWIPSSKHPEISKKLLLACVDSGDSLAATHICSAFQLASSKTHGKLNVVEEVVKLYSQTDIQRCRRALDKLIAEGDPEAMTVQGFFYEQEGKMQLARDLYEKALPLADRKYDPKAPPRAPAVDVIGPWNALGYLLLADSSPESQKGAREAFEVGALEADDPLSYYHLASFYPTSSTEWWKYMSKAAASGHTDAIWQLGNYYLDNVNTIIPNTEMGRSLKWLLTSKPGSAKKYAMEWFEVGAGFGHKPSMMKVAEQAEADGDFQRAGDLLYEISQNPPFGEVEEWPRLVMEARVRLPRIAAKIPQIDPDKEIRIN
ncbi:hypothetical protein BCR34DRAFT_662256 [Clohesyomyces aquaticus]|uniref:Uncharacterized protein n=1 Tax=Clohesyomyces aquaticus TaxID=1231657 RepID=A0A1Y1ZZK0_9PLEO|nr:hypothetical protein BCR34DRAFT_662256 [Clohesyomyces aquaticus]